MLTVAKVSTTTYTLPPAHALTPGQSYACSLTPLGANGKAVGASSSLSFQIQPLGAPTPSGPTGTITTDRPTFTWTPVTDTGHTAPARFTLKVTDSTTNRCSRSPT
jgi:hypothetical protein